MHKGRMKYFISTLISTLGGFQFGYSIAIMAGAILFDCSCFFTHTPHGRDRCQLFSHRSNSRSRPRRACCKWFWPQKSSTIHRTSLPDCSVLLFGASSIPVIILGRIIQGLAAGAAAVVGPIYLVEIAPPSDELVGFYQLAVTFIVTPCSGCLTIQSSRCACCFSPSR